MDQLDVAITRVINSFAGTNSATDFLGFWVSAIGVPLLGLALNQLFLLFVHRRGPNDAGITANHRHFVGAVGW